MHKTLKTLTVSVLTSMMIMGSALAEPEVLMPITLAASLLGTSVDAIERAEDSGITLGEQLDAAGKLDAFKTGLRKQARDLAKKLVLEAQVDPKIANDLLSEVEEYVSRWEAAEPETPIAPFGGNLDSVCRLLDMEQEDLLQALTQQTLGEILVSANKLETYKQQMIDEMQVRLNADVAQGNLERQQAQSLGENMAQALLAWDGTETL